MRNILYLDPFLCEREVDEQSDSEDRWVEYYVDKLKKILENRYINQLDQRIVIDPDTIEELVGSMKQICEDCWIVRDNGNFALFSNFTQVDSNNIQMQRK